MQITNEKINKDKGKNKKKERHQSNTRDIGSVAKEFLKHKAKSKARKKYGFVLIKPGGGS